MPLSDSASLVRHAHENGYAVAQVNTNGAAYDLTRAIVEVADEQQSPMILGAYEANLEYRGFEYGAMVMHWFARRASVPVAIHLDHGHSVGSCRRAIEAGFTSVMIDGSHLSIDENVVHTQQVVELAAPKRVSVEAEVGQLQRLNPDGSISEVKNLADPREVARICHETGIDMLAVGIGNAHGFYKGQPEIHLDLLETLAAASTVPLVLHGSTGLDGQVMRQCIAKGMAKVNLGMLIRARFVQYTAEVIAENEHQNHPWRVSQAVVERIKPHIRDLISVIGSAGRAGELDSCRAG